jgi:tRNA1(Val) A37 N6-methylase TrmN6
MSERTQKVPRETPEERALRRRPPGWVAPGPKPPLSAPHEALPQEDETLSFLSGDFRIFQKRTGNRWSIDELVTAFVASQVSTQYPYNHLDLGCGVGSVLLLLAWRFPERRGVGVEAQAVSADLARRSIRYNGVEGRVAVVDGDLREVEFGERFSLVTGTPPYFPIGSGTISSRVQRAPAAFELRGGIEAYAEAAARFLCENGMFVVCNGVKGNHSEPLRNERALAAAGLDVIARLDVIPRAGKGILFSVYTAQNASTGAAARCMTVSTLIVRDDAFRITDAFAAVRDQFGMPPLR